MSRVTVAFPYDDEAGVPDGYAVTLETRWTGKPPDERPTAVLNLFQWSGPNLYFVECFFGSHPDIACAELHDWFNAQVGGRLF